MYYGVRQLWVEDFLFDSACKPSLILLSRYFLVPLEGVLVYSIWLRRPRILQSTFLVPFGCAYRSRGTNCVKVWLSLQCTRKVNTCLYCCWPVLRSHHVLSNTIFCRSECSDWNDLKPRTIRLSVWFSEPFAVLHGEIFLRVAEQFRLSDTVTCRILVCVSSSCMKPYRSIVMLW
jgi:hypothetical protein